MLKDGQKNPYKDVTLSDEDETILDRAWREVRREGGRRAPRRGVGQWAMLKAVLLASKGLRPGLVLKPTRERKTGKMVRRWMRVGLDAKAGRGQGKSGDHRRAEAFERWFGDSVVVDEEGEPLTVYHGTASAFSRFRKKPSVTAEMHPGGPIGFFFTDNPRIAGEYADYARSGIAELGGQNIIPVYLKLQNPYELTGWDWERGFMPEDATPKAIREIRQQLESEGFDGLIIRYEPPYGTEYVVFHPEQIKSVFNRGTFNPRDPDIRKAARPGLVLKPTRERKTGKVVRRWMRTSEAATPEAPPVAGRRTSAVPAQRRSKKAGRGETLAGDAALVAGIQRAVAERLGRAEHGNTRTNAFFVLSDGTVMASDEYYKHPGDPDAVDVHSHSGVNWEWFVGNAGHLEGFGPMNGGDMYASVWRAARGKGRRSALIMADGRMDTLEIPADKIAALASRSRKWFITQLDMTYAERSEEWERLKGRVGEYEMFRRKLREFTKEHGLLLREGLRWRPHPEGLTTQLAPEDRGGPGV